MAASQNYEGSQHEKCRIDQLPRLARVKLNEDNEPTTLKHKGLHPSGQCTKPRSRLRLVHWTSLSCAEIIIGYLNLSFVVQVRRRSIAATFDHRIVCAPPDPSRDILGICACARATS